MGQAHDRRVLRIWPLDRITSSDSSAEQRRAQAELGAGEGQGWSLGWDGMEGGARSRTVQGVWCEQQDGTGWS